MFITKLYSNIDKCHIIFALLAPFDKIGRKTGSNENVCGIWLKIGSVACSHWTRAMRQFKRSREKTKFEQTQTLHKSKFRTNPNVSGLRIIRPPGILPPPPFILDTASAVVKSFYNIEIYSSILWKDLAAAEYKKRDEERGGEGGMEGKGVDGDGMGQRAIATVAITNVAIVTVSVATIAIATVLIATVVIETIAIVTVAITTIAIATV